ncbi:hypothetical protein CARUB_v10011946mg, partial [Capsella rubella]
YRALLKQITKLEVRADSRWAVGLERVWRKPRLGQLKCNIHSSWCNEQSFCGGAWIVRDHMGEVLYHARDAFLPRSNRISAELSCVLWCLISLHEMHIDSVEVWLDCHAVIEALDAPILWPKYRSTLNKIFQVIRVIGEVSFHLSSPKANNLAREIACSVTRDGRFTSYLALGGPSWLQDRIDRDRRGG